MIAGVRKGEFLVGALRINAKRRNEAYVVVQGLCGIDVHIDGDKARNRALQTDVVAVRLLPGAEWNSSTKLESDDGVAALARAAGVAAALVAPEVEVGAGAGAGAGVADVRPDGEEDDDAVMAALLAGATASAEYQKLLTDTRAAIIRDRRQPAGVVAGIIQHKHNRRVIGTLEPMNPVPAGSCIPITDSFVRLKPVDSRIPFVLIPRHEVPAGVAADPTGHTMELFSAEIMSWGSAGRFPRGMLNASLGEAGQISTELKVIIEENGIDADPFPDSVTEELKAFGAAGDGTWAIPEDELAKRRDFRATRIFSIDPTTAKDLDDALHITALPDGCFEIGVCVVSRGVVGVVLVQCCCCCGE